MEFPIYDKNSQSGQYLDTLGPLAMPQRGTQAGLNVLSPADAIQELKNNTETQQDTLDESTATADASITTVHHLI